MGKGDFDAETLRRVSGFMLRLCYPCLILSLFESFDVERLARWAPVLLVPLLHIALGAALGAVAARVLVTHLPVFHHNN